MTKAAGKYRPSLSTLMNLCATNYMLMLRILADNEEVGQQRSFFISDFLSYTVVVKEVTRYTTLLIVAQDPLKGPEMNSHLGEIFRPCMTIRLYHDARLAEVISSQCVSQIKPRYDYPNQAMHHPDEKHQVNQFLKEWLQLCLQLGQVRISLFN